MGMRLPHNHWHGNKAALQSLAWERGHLTNTGMGTRPPYNHWHGNEATLQSLAWERGCLTITGMGTITTWNGTQFTLISSLHRRQSSSLPDLITARPLEERREKEGQGERKRGRKTVYQKLQVVVSILPYFSVHICCHSNSFSVGQLDVVCQGVDDLCTGKNFLR